ncbi:MAG TPA: LPS assembly protein LptD [Caulobacterales bacterium]|nr:LPS assembly protein LptD [Caulobacterales bacterium]
MVRSGDMADRVADRTPAPFAAPWAALAAALMVSVSPAALAQAAAPPTSEQTDMVLLEADVLTDDQENRTITAEGDVEARYQGRTLRADRVIYDLNAGTIHASGNVQIVHPDGSVQYADQIESDEGLNIGVATELRARFGPNGTLAARAAVRESPTRNELHNVIYTSCPVCEDGSKPPTWAFRARRAVQDQESRVITYNSATFEVAGVPVLYLPYFGHPDPTSGRHSGFMIPDAGANRRVGAFYEQGYYWAISPYSDLTAGVRVHENVNPLLGVQYRKRFYSGDIEIDGTVTQEKDFGTNGVKFDDYTTRSSLFANGRFQVNDYWDWGFGAERISDDLYLRRYDIPGVGERRGPYIGDTHRLISQLFAVGQNATSYSAVTAVSFQGLRENDTTDLLPNILPIAETDHVYADPLLHGQLRVSANAAVLERSSAPTLTTPGDDARASVSASWRKDAVFGPGWLLSPFGEVRQDFFRIETAPQHYESFGRSLALGGAEFSWPFMRPGESFDLVVEPIAMAAWSNDGDDPRIVNEDSLRFELDDSNLFRPNAAPNYDLWEPGGRVSVGIRATARTRRGQSASVTFGRRWRSEAAPGFSVQNNLEGRATDYVGAINADLGRAFAADVRFRLDDETLQVQRLDADVRAAVGRFTANARYYRIDDTLALAGDPKSEITGSVGVRIVNGWRAQLGLRRDLDSDINLQQEISAIYEDDCTFLQIAYTRSETLDRRLGPNEGIQIRVGLRSLGVLGGG